MHCADGLRQRSGVFVRIGHPERPLMVRLSDYLGSEGASSPPSAVGHFAPR